VDGCVQQVEAGEHLRPELARRLDGTGVTVNALHPGFVRSEFGRGGDLGGIYGWGIKYLASPFAISPEKGARAAVYLASSPDVADVSAWSCKASRQPLGRSAGRRGGQSPVGASEKLVASVPA
jgi:NAD(P)-dependent dehydrogenase (short-subunit alcohol dehydrogenase family)